MSVFYQTLRPWGNYELTWCSAFSHAVAGGTLSTTLTREQSPLLTKNVVRCLPTKPVPADHTITVHGNLLGKLGVLAGHQPTLIERD